MQILFAFNEPALIAISGDETRTWVKGRNKGPEAIIEASAYLELYDIETDSEVYKQGIHTDNPIISTGSIIEEIKNRISKHLKNNKFTVLLGGEHSVNLGAVAAHATQKNKFCVLQLDAHTDLRDIYESSKYNHGCVMARIQEICPIVQVGIRSMSLEEKSKISKDKIFFAKDIHKQKGWAENVCKQLPENVYVTIDLDVFDPAIMPSTGTPEPGGLFWYEILELLRKVTQSKKIIGFDIVELCPNKQNHAPDFLAAKLIYKFLSYIFKENKQ